MYFWQHNTVEPQKPSDSAKSSKSTTNMMNGQMGKFNVQMGKPDSNLGKPDSTVPNPNEYDPILESIELKIEKSIEKVFERKFRFIENRIDLLKKHQDEFMANQDKLLKKLYTEIDDFKDDHEDSTRKIKDELYTVKDTLSDINDRNCEIFSDTRELLQKYDSLNDKLEQKPKHNHLEVIADTRELLNSSDALIGKKNSSKCQLRESSPALSNDGVTSPDSSSSKSVEVLEVINNEVLPNIDNLKTIIMGYFNDYDEERREKETEKVNLNQTMDKQESKMVEITSKINVMNDFMAKKLNEIAITTHEVHVITNAKKNFVKSPAEPVDDDTSLKANDAMTKDIGELKEMVATTKLDVKKIQELVHKTNALGDLAPTVQELVPTIAELKTLLGDKKNEDKIVHGLVKKIDTIKEALPQAFNGLMNAQTSKFDETAKLIKESMKKTTTVMTDLKELQKPSQTQKETHQMVLKIDKEIKALKKQDKFMNHSGTEELFRPAILPRTNNVVAAKLDQDANVKKFLAEMETQISGFNGILAQIESNSLKMEKEVKSMKDTREKEYKIVKTCQATSKEIKDGQSAFQDHMKSTTNDFNNILAKIEYHVNKLETKVEELKKDTTEAIIERLPAVQDQEKKPDANEVKTSDLDLKLDQCLGDIQVQSGHFESLTDDLKEIKCTLRNNKSEFKKLKQILDETKEQSSKPITGDQNETTSHSLDEMKEYFHSFDQNVTEKLTNMKNALNEGNKEVMQKISDYKDLINCLNESQMELKSLYTESNKDLIKLDVEMNEEATKRHLEVMKYFEEKTGFFDEFVPTICEFKELLNNVVQIAKKPQKSPTKNASEVVDQQAIEARNKEFFDLILDQFPKIFSSLDDVKESMGKIVEIDSSIGELTKKTDEIQENNKNCIAKLDSMNGELKEQDKMLFDELTKFIKEEVKFEIDMDEIEISLDKFMGKGSIVSKKLDCVLDSTTKIQSDCKNQDRRMIENFVKLTKEFKKRSQGGGSSNPEDSNVSNNDNICQELSEILKELKNVAPAASKHVANDTNQLNLDITSKLSSLSDELKTLITNEITASTGRCIPHLQVSISYFR